MEQSIKFSRFKGLWPSWSDIKATARKVGDSIANGFNKAFESAEDFYENHKKAIDTILKIGGAVVVTGVIVSGIIGGVAGVVSGSSRNVTDLSQTALDHALISIAPAMGIEEMFRYMIGEVIHSTMRNLATETGRYLAASNMIFFCKMDF